MATTKDRKHIEISKDAHKQLVILKATQEFFNMTEVIMYLLKNQK